MIIFKEKIFFAPLLAAAAAPAAAATGSGLGTMAVANGIGLLGLGQGAVGMVQSDKLQKESLNEQKKMQEQQIKATRDQNAKMMKTLKQVARNNPGVAGAAAGQQMGMMQQNFSFTATTAKNLLKAGKSLGLHKTLASTAITGASMAGAGYLADKAIQADAKKSGIDLGGSQEEAEEKKKKNRKFLGKSALAIGTSALAVAAAKKGLLGKPLKTGANYVFNKDVAKKVGRTFKNAAKENLDIRTKHGRISTAFTLGFGAMPALSYASQKRAIKDQEKASSGETNGNSEQRTYAVPISYIPKKYRAMVSGWSRFKAAPGQNILGGVSSFMGGGGKEGTKKFVNELKSEGAKTGDKASVNIAKFLDKHKKTALGGSIVLGGLAFKGFDIGDKAVNASIGSIDKNSKKYRDSQEKTVN